MSENDLDKGVGQSLLLFGRCRYPSLLGVLVGEGEPRKTLSGHTDGGAMRYPVDCAHCRAFTSSG